MTSVELVFPFLFALLLFSPLCQGAVTCPNCGNTTVPYPLSTSSSCGDAKYQVGCNMSEGRLSLILPSGSYPIINIAPNSQRLTVQSPPISSNSCLSSDFRVGGLNVGSSSPFNITTSNTVFLLNCSEAVLVSPMNCTSKSLCSQFLAQDREGEPCVGKICCTFTAGGPSPIDSVIEVRDGGCTAYVSVVMLNPSLPVKEWRYGIELEWVSPLEPICSPQSDCDKLSTCQRDSRSNGFRCLCNQGYQWNGSTGTCIDIALLCSNSSHCWKRKLHAGPDLIAGVAVAIVLCCGLAGILFVIGRRRAAAKKVRRKLTKERQAVLSEGRGGRSAKVYTIEEMKRATHNFANERLLGSGGFGDVYKGVLADGTVVAVKSAKVGNVKGIEQVLNEVRILSRINHRGLVMLLGCCVETQQPLLVYEYIPNGTLLDHLKGGRGVLLDWHMRLRVAVQTAEGLAYLHSAASPPIYHCDVKSSNILLDAKLNAKVSDFGVSRLSQADLSHISTYAQGTIGYLDPEYYRNYQLTAKSDVYSFGVVLLELVTSQRAVEFARGEDDINLAVYVTGKAREGRVMEVVDRRLLSGNHDDITAPSAAGFESAPSTAFNSSSTSDLNSSSTGSSSAVAVPLSTAEPSFVGGDMVGEAAIVAESIYKVVYLALSCVQDRRSDRPSMMEVAEKLQRSLQELGAALGLSSRDIDFEGVSTEDN